MPTVDREPLHRFHSYCARFPSEIADAALEKYTKAEESVLDPFCGSGTALVACLANGRKAVGADIDILAGMLTEAKCNPRAREEYDAWRESFAARLTLDFAEIGRAWTRGASPPLGMAWRGSPCPRSANLREVERQPCRETFPPGIVLFPGAGIALCFRQHPRQDVNIGAY